MSNTPLRTARRRPGSRSALSEARDILQHAPVLAEQVLMGANASLLVGVSIRHPLGLYRKTHRKLTRRIQAKSRVFESRLAVRKKDCFSARGGVLIGAYSPGGIL
jgi:hypothetical protein